MAGPTILSGEIALSTAPTLLEVTGLSIAFPTNRGAVEVVHALDLAAAADETLAIVGESGSGKSVTALAITRLIDHTGGHITAGRVGFVEDGRQGTRHGLAARLVDLVEHATVVEERRLRLGPAAEAAPMVNSLSCGNWLAYFCATVTSRGR
jgi:ABC-type dipeptide/oligopeptide/nickel transport system ATPase component